MKKLSFRNISISFAAFFLIALPLAAPFALHAAGGLVPCDGPGNTGSATGDVPCNWDAFVLMISKIENYAFIFGFAVTAVMIGYAGLKMVMDAGSGKAVSEAKSIFMATAKGFIIMLGAWVFVKFILYSLLNTDFQGFIGPYFK